MMIEQLPAWLPSSLSSDEIPFGQILVTSGTALVLCLIIQFVMDRRRMIQMIEKLPGPPLKGEHPLLAHLCMFSKTVGKIPGKPHLPLAIHIFETLANDYKGDGMFRLWVFSPYYFPFSRSVVVLFDPQLSRDLLTDKRITTKLIKDKRIYDISAPVIGDSFLAMEDGPQWKIHRKIAAAGFHQKFLEFVNSTAVKLLQEKVFPAWDAAIQKKQSNTTGDPFTLEAAEWSTRLVLEILGEVGFSCSFGGLEGSTSKSSSSSRSRQRADGEESLYDIYQYILLMVTRRSRSPPLIPWFWIKDNIRFRRCCNRLNAIIEKIVRGRLAEEESNNNLAAQKSSPARNGAAAKQNGERNNYTDLLSYLLAEDDDGNRLPYKYLFGNTRMFLFAGHDTTASVLASALWELATNPKVQKRLQQEVDEAFGKLDSSSAASGETLRYKDLMQLKYLDAVVKESLRKHASAGVARQTVDDITLKKEEGREYVIPKGTTLYNIPTIGHRIDSYYTNPQEFWPDRFIPDEQSTTTTTDAMKNWYPFSYGPRNCVGQPLAVAELKIILAHLTHRYNLKRNANAIDPIPVFTLVIKPHEVLLDIERRS